MRAPTPTSWQSAADVLHVGPHDVIRPHRGTAGQPQESPSGRSATPTRSSRWAAAGGAPASADETVNGITYVGRAVEGISAKDVKGLVDTEKKRIGSGVVTVVLKGEDGRGTVAVGVTDDLTAGTRPAIS
jgi:alanyl-tRNA synthetase